MKIYISFGQCHVHTVNGNTFDKDSLCEIECASREEGRAKAFEVFGDKFFTDYSEGQLPNILHYYPRGPIPLEAS